LYDQRHELCYMPQHRLWALVLKIVLKSHNYQIIISKYCWNTEMMIREVDDIALSSNGVTTHLY
jgi:hypothetical protein